MLVAAAELLPNDTDAVDPFQCRTAQQVSTANIRDVYEAYGYRSAAIIKVAQGENATRLAEMVAPTAKFTVFQGDVGIGPRSSGPEAAVDFAKQIAPSSYQFSVGSSGPFVVNPCSAAIVELTLKRQQSDKVVIATFKYREGLLVEVKASQVDLVFGKFQRPQRSSVR